MTIPSKVLFYILLSACVGIHLPATANVYVVVRANFWECVLSFYYVGIELRFLGLEASAFVLSQPVPKVLHKMALTFGIVV